MGFALNLLFSGFSILLVCPSWEVRPKILRRLLFMRKEVHMTMMMVMTMMMMMEMLQGSLLDDVGTLCQVA